MANASRTIPQLKPKKKKRKWKKNHKRKITLEEHHKNLSSICTVIADGQHWFHRDPYGRVHTPISTLAKELRQCLKVNGRSLVEIDLKNSQPLITGICGIQFFSSKSVKKTLPKLNFSPDSSPYRYQSLARFGARLSKNGISHLTAQEKELAQLGPIPADLVQYIRDCEAGLFYESLMSPGEDREAFKERIYEEVFYGSGKKPSKLRNRFARMYPSVMELLENLKAADYRRSSWIMQSIESTIFIYQICGRIMLEKPDIPIYTIHDSIMTLPEHLPYVQSVILQSFNKFGIHPKLSVKAY